MPSLDVFNSSAFIVLSFKFIKHLNVGVFLQLQVNCFSAYFVSGNSDQPQENTAIKASQFHPKVLLHHRFQGVLDAHFKLLANAML